MMSDVAQALIDLTASVSHDPDEADWFDVHETIELTTNPAAVLREILHYCHEEHL